MKTIKLTPKEISVLKDVANNVFTNIEWCEDNECYRENYDNFFQSLKKDEYEALSRAISKL